jgi:hypothetical protein
MSKSHLDIATAAMRWQAAYTRKAAANSIKRKLMANEKVSGSTPPNFLATSKNDAELAEVSRMEIRERRALLKVCAAARGDLSNTDDAERTIDGTFLICN